MLYLRSELNEYSFTYVRKIGRNIGVKSPTSMTKDKIIDCILAIQKGEMQPVFTKRGRPAKTISPVNEHFELQKKYSEKERQRLLKEKVSKYLEKLKKEIYAYIDRIGK